MNGWNVIRDLLALKAGSPATETGFRLAFNLALVEIWGKTEAVSMPDIEAYVGAPFGADGYAWTPEAAVELARAYALDYGE